MELTEYLFMIFTVSIITMTSHIKVEVFMMKQLVFIVVVIVIVIVIAILDKQLCKLYISDTNEHNDNILAICGTCVLDQSIVIFLGPFHGGTDGFNPYDYKIK